MVACDDSSAPGTPSDAAGSGGAAGAAGSGGAVGVAGSGCGAASAASAPAEPTDACTVAEDCAWGEINHEIRTTCDCICLFGCPGTPLSKSTLERRNAQYDARCTRGKDGAGQACPVDDCAAPPPIACVNGRCQAAPPGLVPDAG